MTVRVPLTVRLVTSRRDVNVTNQVRDLSFRSVAPGGFASCTIPLDRPLMMQPDEIENFGRVVVYDGRHGGVVWEGRMEDPGRSAGADGQVWELTAIGPSGHAEDATRTLIYIDTSTSGWRRSKYNKPTANTGSADEDADALEMSAPQGSDPDFGYYADLVYTGVSEARMTLARVSGTVTSGMDNDNWSNKLMTRDRSTGSAPTERSSRNMRIDPWTHATKRDGSADLPATHDVAHLRLFREDSTNVVGNDLVWSQWRDVCVRGLLYEADGSLITSVDSRGLTAYTTNYIHANQVVRDLLGRLLPLYDGTNAVVTGTEFDIDQLAYPDGATPAQILSDLMLLEPAFYWAAWETNSSGKYRFLWDLWPTEVRYEADVQDGFDSPASTEGLWNAVNVRWTGPNGGQRSTLVSSVVPELDAIGLTRRAFLDLGDEIGSEAQAERAGGNFLFEHRHPPNAGTLDIARPIRDLIEGRLVMPWEIRPANLIRVRGVMPRLDALNATDRDGATVFRIVGADYSQSSNTASLELDSFSRTEARAIAGLSNDFTGRRRR